MSVTTTTAPTVLAVCGKGGVGKTVVSALLARVMLDHATGPLLLVDADPVTGLLSAVGHRAERTLADVREQLLSAATGSDDTTRERLARELDYRVLEVLAERDGYAMLAMGRPLSSGCFCPVHSLLKHALADLAAPFAVVLIDAEAGVEQVHREVMSRVDLALAVTDGSARSRHAVGLLAELLGADRVAVVQNRRRDAEAAVALHDHIGLRLVGSLPEDPELAELDRQGRPLWDLPGNNAALRATAQLARSLGLIGSTP